MPASRDDKEVHAARRLCELFKGRFSENVARQIILDLGGELQAVDFILNEDTSVVNHYLKKNPDYVENIRSDSKKIATLLENGIEYEIRQFACEGCVRSWWKKVPYRKQVSKCDTCKVKYDPVPQENEWGWAEFVCACSNIFYGFGEMNVTISKCYKCGGSVPVDKVIPPRKQIPSRRKSYNPHSCNGVNCFNRHCDNYISSSSNSAGVKTNVSWYKSSHAVRDNISYSNIVIEGKPAQAFEGGAFGGNGAGPGEAPVCVHPKSATSNRYRIRTPSKRHVSTGSTVDTFLTQGSLLTATVSVAFTLDRIDEVDSSDDQMAPPNQTNVHGGVGFIPVLNKKKRRNRRN